MPGIKTALIVGGGIGGLTAAVALQRIGIDVTVFERAKALQEIGAGLWLWQNALYALDTLGIGDEIRAAGVQNAHGGVRSSQGRILVERMPSRREVTSVAILRSELQATLLRVLDPNVIQLGSDCIDFVQDATGVTLELSDKRQIRGDILVAADGIHSTIRAKLFGSVKPKYAGFTAWRAVASFPHDQIPAGVSWGCGARIGFMPISRDRVNWFAGRKLPVGTPDASIGRKRELVQYFHGWYDPVPRIIEATDEADIIKNDIFVGPRLKSWSKGRVALLGDAAHAMTPSIGQGACQAIEDATELASCVRERPDDPAGALQHYDQRRVARANAVVRYSRLMDWLALWQNMPLCGLRNFLVEHAPNWLRDRQFDWILNYHTH